MIRFPCRFDPAPHLRFRREYTWVAQDETKQYNRAVILYRYRAAKNRLLSVTQASSFLVASTKWNGEVLHKV